MSDEFPPLNANPVHNGQYQWGDVTVSISPDASRIEIQHGDANVIVEGTFFRDMVTVLERCRKESEPEQASAVLYHTVQTSRSLPDAEW